MMEDKHKLGSSAVAGFLAGLLFSCVLFIFAHQCMIYAGKEIVNKFSTVEVSKNTVVSPDDPVPGVSGKWYDIGPGGGFLIYCCDCGLVHRCQVTRDEEGSYHINYTREEGLTKRWRMKKRLRMKPPVEADSSSRMRPLERSERLQEDIHR